MEFYDVSSFLVVEIFFVLLAFVGVFGITIFRCILAPSHVLPKGRKVGPTYWGMYENSSRIDDPGHVVIEVPRPILEETIVAGGTSYSKGKAIKSARAK